MLGIIVRGDVKRGAVFGADFLQSFLQAGGDALGIQNVGPRKDQRKNIRRKTIDRICGAEFARHGLGGVAPGFGTAVEFCGRVNGLGFHEQDGKRFLHGHGPPVFHGQAIPEMILVGDGLEQIHAGLVLQGDVAVQLREQVLLQFANGALAVEQVAVEEESQRAEAGEGHAQRPFVPDRVDKDQRVHECRQAAGKYQNKYRCQDRELQLTAFKIV